MYMTIYLVISLPEIPYAPYIYGSGHPCTSLHYLQAHSLSVVCVCACACAPFASHGDNNYSDDRGLYPKGQEWLNRDHIMGRAIG